MGMENGGSMDQGKERKDQLRSQEDVTPDYEKMLPEIFDPNTDKEFQGWLVQNQLGLTAYSVATYAKQELAAKFYLPDVRYMRYVKGFKQAIPDRLKALEDNSRSNSYYLAGSAFVDQEGGVHMPYMGWSGEGGWSNFPKNHNWNDDKRLDVGSNGKLLLLKEETEQEGEVEKD